MKLPVIDPAVAIAIRRCPTPSDLSIITHIGDESGSGEQADAVWALVEDVYRSGMHPGIQVCVRHEGEVVLDRSIGHATGIMPGRRFDPDRAVPLTLDTPVNLFSAAKAVTGVVMHKLEEDGVLSLDDRVADHIPGFERHGKGDITIRHVITHHAHIAKMPAEAFDLDLLADPDEVERILCDLHPTAVPGSFPEYHAVTGGFVMEAVTRRATGSSLRDVLAAEIKEPLGLEWFDYGVDPDQVDLVAKNIETGLRVGPLMSMFFKRILGKGWSEVLEMSNDPRFLSAVVPSGNLIVRARDVAVFYQCIMNGGEYDGTRVFKEKTIERLLHPPHAEPVFDRMIGFPVIYGGGFMLGSSSFSPFGWNRPGAFGHVGMSNLWTWADGDRDLVVAILNTGKPIIGPHLAPFVKMIAGINEVYPSPEATTHD